MVDYPLAILAKITFTKLKEQKKIIEGLEVKGETTFTLIRVALYFVCPVLIDASVFI
jgi:hypothetical protein